MMILIIQCQLLTARPPRSQNLLLFSGNFHQTFFFDTYACGRITQTDTAKQFEYRLIHKCIGYSAYVQQQ